MNLYFISGLGADKRIFQNLVIPKSYTVHHIEWLTVSKKESLKAYCHRLSAQIDQQHPFSLIGVSFGGIIAIELSQIVKPRKTIIISSFLRKDEVPFLYRLVGRSRIHELLPIRFLLKPNGFIFRVFGAVNPDGKLLLENILRETDPAFFRWAILQMFSWDNQWKPESFLHIHGTADKILPLHKNMLAIPVEGGEHLMVYNKPEIISRLLD